jgi:hypothetical protein
MKSQPGSAHGHSDLVLRWRAATVTLGEAHVQGKEAETAAGSIAMDVELTQLMEQIASQNGNT